MQSIITHHQVWLTIVIFIQIIDGTTSLTWRNCSDSVLQSVRQMRRAPFSLFLWTMTSRMEKALRIAVSRIAHTSAEADYQGVLFVKRGGIGSSGLTNLLLLPFENTSKRRSHL